MVGKSSMQIARDRVMQEVRKHFRPKLLNKLDEIVVFDPLSHEQLRKVARLQMKDVDVRLVERGVALAVADAALNVYGARPIRRCLGKRVVTQLSKMLIKEEIDEHSTVYIDALPGKKDLSYRVEKNGGFFNSSTGQKSDILISVPSGVKTDAAQAVKKMKIVAADNEDEEMVDDE